MSEVFDVVVLPVCAETASEALARIIPSVAMVVRDLPGLGSFVYREPANPRKFSDLIEDLAERLSAVVGKALLILYDSRVGFRHSRLYTNGAVTRYYGEVDAIFVLLDENGRPRLNGKQYEYSELEELGEDEEYETIHNAIELGLMELGWVDEGRPVGLDGRREGGPWEEIHLTMGRL